MAQPAIARLDGRTARRERGRAAVVDAAFELISEGQVPPDVNDLAARSGVSVSSIFRYFDGLADVQVQAMHRFEERFDHLFRLEDRSSGSRSERVHVFVDKRLSLFNEVGVLLAVARLRGLENSVLAEGNERIAGRLRDQVRHQFESELRSLTHANAAALAGAIDSYTSPQSWELLQSSHTRGQRQTRQAWVTGTLALISAWPPESAQL